MANAYIMRTNMSVAIVAMVNHTALPKDDTVLDNECDSDNSSSSWVAEMSKKSEEVNYYISLFENILWEKWPVKVYFSYIFIIMFKTALLWEECLTCCE